MIKQSILLFVLISSTKAFAINDANTYRVYHRIKRSVSASITPNIIQINNELSEWHENNSTRNNLLIGQCGVRDQRVYTDDILVENSGPSTLNGTLEVLSIDFKFFFFLFLKLMSKKFRSTLTHPL